MRSSSLATTAPAWTPLFGLAAAIVTEGGALAARASIVAREYGIPAVVGTGDATTRLVTGQWVTVDGTTGMVTVTGGTAAHERRRLNFIAARVGMTQGRRTSGSQW